MKRRSRIIISDLALTALFASFIAVCSFVSVPVSAVPMTLQAFAVLCASAILGPKLAMSAVLCYILLGAVGLPVFHGFHGGVGVLFGSTGGFIFGFIPTAFSVGALAKYFKPSILGLFFAMLLGMLPCYAVGCAWYAFLFGNGDIGGAVMTCVVPFLLPDALKAAAAAVVSSRASKYIGQIGAKFIKR